MLGVPGNTPSTCGLSSCHADGPGGLEYEDKQHAAAGMRLSSKSTDVKSWS
jgi:hypothetical protein